MNAEGNVHRLAELRTAAERAGYALRHIGGDRFVVGRWGLCRELKGMEEVAAWLERATGTLS